MLSLEGIVREPRTVKIPQVRSGETLQPQHHLAVLKVVEHQRRVQIRCHRHWGKKPHLQRRGTKFFIEQMVESGRRSILLAAEALSVALDGFSNQSGELSNVGMVVLHRELFTAAAPSVVI